MKVGILIHNPRCSKSRGAKEILELEKIHFDVIDYLKEEIPQKIIESLPSLLNLSFSEMIRKNEDVYSELGLKDSEPTDLEWIEIIKKNPILLERPIFIYQGQAIIARPPNLVKNIL